MINKAGSNKYISKIFAIDDIVLAKPVVNNNKFYTKITNTNNTKNSIVLTNIKLLQEKKNNNSYVSLNCIADLDLKIFLLKLENKLSTLYSNKIADSDSLSYEPIIRFKNLHLISRFILNKNLEMVDDLNLDHLYNVSIELYSLLQENNNIKILWKLKSLEVIESIDNNDVSDDEIDHLNNIIDIEKETIMADVLRKLNYQKKEYKKIEKIYNYIKSEINIDKINLIYQEFLEK